MNVEHLAKLLDRLEELLREPCTEHDRMNARGALSELRAVLPRLGDAQKESESS